MILPRRNERNLLEDVPKPLRESMTFHLVDSVEEVLDLALEDALPRAGRIKDALLTSRNLSTVCGRRSKRLPSPAAVFALRNEPSFVMFVS